jgi:hypothetical protein
MKILIAFIAGYATKAFISYIQSVYLMQKFYDALDKEWLD